MKIKGEEKQGKAGFFERISKSLDIDADMLFGGFGVSLKGKYRAEVCGVKRIMEYSDKRLTFVTADGTFFICGNRLYCSAYKNKAVIVEGEIEKMGFDMGDENGNY